MAKQGSVSDPAQAVVARGALAGATEADQATVLNGIPPPPAGENLVALPPGSQIHEYAIQAVLGSGGFGITYLAHDANLQCAVAIKEYLPSGIAVRTPGGGISPCSPKDDEVYRQGLQRFLGEARVLASFRHYNIVRVTRFFEANNTAYMVMDYEKGLSLREWIKLHGAPDEKTLLEMFMPLLVGLDIVHRAGVLHRDIKPTNIYVRESDGSLVLLDFGAARYVAGSSSRSLTSMVTPGYAPFEQYHAHGVQGPWSDIYALGGVLYWVVTGQKPLEAPSRIKTDAMPAATSLAKGRYSRPLLQAIDWALMSDEQVRPKSVAEMRCAMTGEAAVRKENLPPSTFLGLTVRKQKVLAALVAAGVLVGGLWVWFADTSSPEKAVVPVAALPLATPAAIPPATVAGAVSQPVPSGAEAVQTEFGLVKPDSGPAPVAWLKGDSPPAPSAPAKTKAPPVRTESPKTMPVPVAPVEAKAMLIFNVTPNGTVHLDGKVVGTSPPLRQLAVSPGKHSVEVHGTLPPGVHYFQIEVGPNEKKTLQAEFANVRF